MNNTWEAILEYFNVFGKGEITSRRGLIFCLHMHSPSVLDTYKKYLTRAGYLEIIAHGKYKILKQIPYGFTIEECKNQMF